MTEIMGEIELRLRPPADRQFAFEPSFDNRVDSAISTLEVLSLYLFIYLCVCTLSTLLSVCMCV